MAVTRDEAIEIAMRLGREKQPYEAIIDLLATLGVLALQQPEKETPDEKFTRYMRERGWKEDVIAGARANIIRAGLMLAEPMHPHLANALERARAWSETYPVGRLGESGPFEAVRLLRDVAEASK